MEAPGKTFQLLATSTTFATGDRARIAKSQNKWSVVPLTLTYTFADWLPEGLERSMLIGLQLDNERHFAGVCGYSSLCTYVALSLLYRLLFCSQCDEGKSLQRYLEPWSVVVRLLASQHGEPGTNPGVVSPGFLHVGIVPHDGIARGASWTRHTTLTCRAVFPLLYRRGASSPAINGTSLTGWSSVVGRVVKRVVHPWLRSTFLRPDLLKIHFIVTPPPHDNKVIPTSGKLHQRDNAPDSPCCSQCLAAKACDGVPATPQNVHPLLSPRNPLSVYGVHYIASPHFTLSAACIELQCIILPLSLTLSCRLVASYSVLYCLSRLTLSCRLVASYSALYCLSHLTLSCRLVRATVHYIASLASLLSCRLVARYSVLYCLSNLTLSWRLVASYSVLYCLSHFNLSCRLIASYSALYCISHFTLSCRLVASYSVLHCLSQLTLSCRLVASYSVLYCLSHLTLSCRLVASYSGYIASLTSLCPEACRELQCIIFLSHFNLSCRLIASFSVLYCLSPLHSVLQACRELQCIILSLSTHSVLQACRELQCIILPLSPQLCPAGLSLATVYYIASLTSLCPGGLSRATVHYIASLTSLCPAGLSRATVYYIASLTSLCPAGLSLATVYYIELSHFTLSCRLVASYSVLYCLSHFTLSCRLVASYSVLYCLSHLTLSCRLVASYSACRELQCIILPLSLHSVLQACRELQCIILPLSPHSVLQACRELQCITFSLSLHSVLQACRELQINGLCATVGPKINYVGSLGTELPNILYIAGAVGVAPPHPIRKNIPLPLQRITGIIWECLRAGAIYETRARGISVSHLHRGGHFGIISFPPPYRITLTCEGADPCFVYEVGIAEPIRVKRGEHGTAPEYRGGGNGRSPRKPVGTIPMCKNPGVTPPGIAHLKIMNLNEIFAKFKIHGCLSWFVAGLSTLRSQCGGHCGGVRVFLGLSRFFTLSSFLCVSTPISSLSTHYSGWPEIRVCPRERQSATLRANILSSIPTPPQASTTYRFHLKTVSNCKVVHDTPSTCKSPAQDLLKYTFCILAPHERCLGVKRSDEQLNIEETCDVCRDAPCRLPDMQPNHGPRCIPPHCKIETAKSGSKSANLNADLWKLLQLLTRPMTMKLFHKAEEYTTDTQVDLMQGYQKCSFHREQRGISETLLSNTQLVQVTRSAVSTTFLLKCCLLPETKVEAALRDEWLADSESHGLPLSANPGPLSARDLAVKPCLGMTMILLQCPLITLVLCSNTGPSTPTVARRIGRPLHSRCSGGSLAMAYDHPSSGHHQFLDSSIKDTITSKICKNVGEVNNTDKARNSKDATHSCGFLAQVHSSGSTDRGCGVAIGGWRRRLLTMSHSCSIDFTSGDRVGQYVWYSVVHVEEIRAHGTPKKTHVRMENFGKIAATILLVRSATRRERKKERERGMRERDREREREKERDLASATVVVFKGTVWPQIEFTCRAATKHSTCMPTSPLALPRFKGLGHAEYFQPMELSASVSGEPDNKLHEDCLVQLLARRRSFARCRGGGVAGGDWLLIREPPPHYPRDAASLIPEGVGVGLGTGCSVSATSSRLSAAVLESYINNYMPLLICDSKISAYNYPFSFFSTRFRDFTPVRILKRVPLVWSVKQTWLPGEVIVNRYQHHTFHVSVTSPTKHHSHSFDTCATVSLEYAIPEQEHPASKIITSLTSSKISPGREASSITLEGRTEGFGKGEGRRGCRGGHGPTRPDVRLAERQYVCCYPEAPGGALINYSEYREMSVCSVRLHLLVMVNYKSDLVALNSEVLRADEDYLVEYKVTPECKDGGNGRFPRKFSDQWHCLAQFPHVQIQESSEGCNGDVDQGVERWEIWVAFKNEGEMEQRRNARAGDTGHPRENPPTQGHPPARLPRAKIRKRFHWESNQVHNGGGPASKGGGPRESHLRSWNTQSIKYWKDYIYSPGPIYALPPTFGYEGHDKTRHRNPAWTMGKRLETLKRKGVDNGPIGVPSHVTRFGAKRVQGKTFGERPRDLST
ncbi:hypothetical protein PR048_022723 [Dryococelus australis]|uniref:Uncharacterized protein n=1 Tax=Dryococelus australis TaxID=614101 RepID=A0ABQ9GS20_9NEOP|nr:hypothetical protein PR048_022723 [Dryococelus australis]